MVLNNQSLVVRHFLGSLNPSRTSPVELVHVAERLAGNHLSPSPKLPMTEITTLLQGEKYAFEKRINGFRVCVKAR